MKATGLLILTLLRIIKGSEEYITCKVIVSRLTLINIGTQTVYECERLESLEVISLDGVFSDKQISEHSEEIDEGDWVIRFPSCLLEGTPDFDRRLRLHDNSTLNTIQTVPQRKLRKGVHRKTRETMPTETNLVVLISTTDASPVLNEASAAQIAFGPSDSAATQFRDCSGGEFEFARYTGYGITNGIISLSLSRSVGTLTRVTVRTAAQSALCVALGFSSVCDPAPLAGIDHILYVAPYGLMDGSQFGFLYGAVSGTYSVYGDSSGFPPAFAVESILHELSHNFRLGHAREDLNPSPDGDTTENPEYGDDSGMMGSSFYLWGSQNGDKRCFNGYNYWELGWMKTKRLEITSGYQIVEIVGITEQGSMRSNQYTYVKVGDLYITFNLARSFNAQTKEHIDQLIVVEKIPNQQRANYFETDFRAGLDMFQRRFSWDNIVVLVCDVSLGSPGFMRVAIGERASCASPSNPNPVPTAPSFSPPFSPDDPSEGRNICLENGNFCRNGGDCCSGFCAAESRLGISPIIPLFKVCRP